MKKLVVLSSIAIICFAGFVIYASAHNVELAQTSTIAIEDLEVSKPALLPTSPFYFFKELGRGIQIFFTFNQVSKAELELKFTDEKAAETKEVIENDPGDSKGLERATENYQNATDKLRSRLEKLRETSQNQNVDMLLNRLADRAIKHSKLFEELKEKTATQDTDKKLDNARDKLSDGLLKATEHIEDQDKLVRRLKKAVDEHEEKDELEQIRKVEFFDHLEKLADENFKEKLRRAREDFLGNIQNILEERFKEDSKEEISEHLKKLPGDPALRAKIISELKLRSKKTHEKYFEHLENELEEDADKDHDRKEKAEEQIREASEKISDLEKKIATHPNRVTETVKKHLANAKDKLVRSKEAFQKNGLGEAFGQATAAEAEARAGLRLIEKEDDDDDDLREDIDELQEKIDRFSKELQRRESEPWMAEADRLLKEAIKHIGFARDALVLKDDITTKLHISHVKDWLRDLAHLISKKRSDSSAPKPSSAPPIKPIFNCAETKQNLLKLDNILSRGEISKDEYLRKREILMKQLADCESQEDNGDDDVAEIKCGSVKCFRYDPVCGADGKTYSCGVADASACGVKVAYIGECKTPEKSDTTITPTPTNAMPLPTNDTQSPVQEKFVTHEFKLEADDKGFYPSGIIRVAKGAKVELTFVVRRENVYYGGLDFRSPKFKTSPVKPGDSATVEFTADESFEFQSFWPLSSALKATGKVVIQ